MKWYKFDSKKGYHQRRPDIKKFVLLLLQPLDSSYPCRVVVGYRKDAAGDKMCPYFVRPGAGFPKNGRYSGADVIAWCDCLPSGFSWPSLAEDFNYKGGYGP